LTIGKNSFAYLYSKYFIYGLEEENPVTPSVLCGKAEELSGGKNKEVVRWAQEAQQNLQAQKDREKKMYQAISPLSLIALSFYKLFQCNVSDLFSKFSELLFSRKLNLGKFH